MTDSSDHEEPFGYTEVKGARQYWLEQAKKSKEQAINRLWASNATGMFAVLGAFWAGKAHGSSISAALIAFIIGILMLAIGAFSSLISEIKMIRSLEEADSLLDMKPDQILRPSEEAGLTVYNAQTLMALLSAVSFFVGVVLCLYFAIFG